MTSLHRGWWRGLGYVGRWACSRRCLGHDVALRLLEQEASWNLRNAVSEPLLRLIPRSRHTLEAHHLPKLQGRSSHS